MSLTKADEKTHYTTYYSLVIILWSSYILWSYWIFLSCLLSLVFLFKDIQSISSQSQGKSWLFNSMYIQEKKAYPSKTVFTKYYDATEKSHHLSQHICKCLLLCLKQFTSLLIFVLVLNTRIVFIFISSHKAMPRNRTGLGDLSTFCSFHLSDLVWHVLWRYFTKVRLSSRKPE